MMDEKEETDIALQEFEAKRQGVLVWGSLGTNLENVGDNSIYIYIYIMDRSPQLSLSKWEKYIEHWSLAVIMHLHLIILSTGPIK